MKSLEAPVFAPNRRHILFGGAGILLSAGPAAAQTEAGAVEMIKGSANATRGKKQLALRAKAPVLVGDLIETGKDSRLALRLGQTTEVKLGADARLRIDSFVMNAGGVLELERGALQCDIEQATQESSNLSVRSQFGVVAVRGTRFFAGPSAGVFGVFVYRGSVDVTAAGQTVTLGVDRGTSIKSAGDPPGDVIPWGEPRIKAAIAAVS